MQKNELDDTFECDLFREDELISQGQGSTKKKAEQDASQSINLLNHVISN